MEREKPDTPVRIALLQLFVFIWAAIAFFSSTEVTNALQVERLNGQLMKLDPETRLEQTGGTEVMFRINRENRKFSIDKVIAYAFGDTISDENSFVAPGAVLRGRGEWYRLSYTCTTGLRHLDANKLNYEIGPIVPRSKWQKHFLYD